MKKIAITLGLAVLAFYAGNAQTKEERIKITADYDIERFEELQREFQSQNKARQDRISRIANKKGWAKSIKDDLNTSVLYDIIDGKPVYITTDNIISVLMQGADALHKDGSLGINIEGQNMEVGIWDGGLVLPTHEALQGRVIEGQPLPTSDSHGTHVGGTIISNAPNLNARGIAPQASLISYDFDNDLSEMVPEAFGGLLLSNHSYGIPADGGLSTQFLGKYIAQSVSFDNVAAAAPFYLPVVSAGNDRGRGINASDSGYDLLVGFRLSKNVLTVGATVGQANYTGPSSVQISSFTSWGPADDGRVKPDISTKGVATFSTDDASDSSYRFREGTSMSTPAVTGGLTLLQQYYNSLNNNFMRAATLKGLALHTVNEVGNADGPDYQFGWGILNTEAAAIAIRDDGSSAIIEENTLANNGSYSKIVEASESSNLVISISWTDPAGSVNNGPEDDTTPALRNDLDVIVTDSNGTNYYPWKLDPINPEQPATNNTPNDVDNFEKIEIPNPSGTYTIVVNHKGSLQGSSQNYALIVTGIDQDTASTSDADNLTNLSLYPNPANDKFTVTFNNELSGDTINVQVYDVLGQLVIDNKYDNNGVFEQTIKLSQLDSGLYLVKVGNGITSNTKKLIIK